MELLKLSKFKLQLRSLITEARDLKERERAANDQIHVLIQKQKQTDEEYGRNLQELQSELAASNEQKEKLERQVSYLQNDYAMLENKQKELKGTLQNLLQSRENFLNSYEESTSGMKRTIEMRDRKLTVLLEKLNSYILLFESIEKEALSVKQLVDNVQCLVSEKEEVVAGLKSRMDEVSDFEKLYVEKISDLENKLKTHEDELRRKDKIITELEAQLEVKVTNSCQTEMQDLQKTLSVKDMVIQNLISEKEKLHHQVGSLGVILQRIQESVTNMDEEDKKVFSLMLVYQEERGMDMTEESDRIDDAVQDAGINSPDEASGIGNAGHREQNSVENPVGMKNNVNSRVSEDNRTKLVYLDKQCSTTEAEKSEDPGVEP